MTIKNTENINNRGSVSLRISQVGSEVSAVRVDRGVILFKWVLDGGKASSGLAHLRDSDTGVFADVPSQVTVETKDRILITGSGTGPSGKHVEFSVILTRVP